MSGAERAAAEPCEDDEARACFTDVFGLLGAEILACLKHEATIFLASCSREMLVAVLVHRRVVLSVTSPSGSPSPVLLAVLAGLAPQFPAECAGEIMCRDVCVDPSCAPRLAEFEESWRAEDDAPDDVATAALLQSLAQDPETALLVRRIAVEPPFRRKDAAAAPQAPTRPKLGALLPAFKHLRHVKLNCAADMDALVDVCSGIPQCPELEFVTTRRIAPSSVVGAAALCNALTERARLCPPVPLRWLDLGYSSLGDRGALVLAAALKAEDGMGARLTVLRLVDTGIGAPGAKAIGGALVVCRRLQELDLSLNSLISDSGAVAIAQGLSEGPCDALTTLRMAGCQMSDVGVAAVGAALARLPSLTKLSLRSNSAIGCKPAYGEEAGPGEGALGLADGLRTCRALEELELHGTVPRSNQALACIADGIGRGGCPRLRVLRFTGYSVLSGGVSATAIVDALARGCGATLEKLEIGAYGADNATLEAFGKRMLPCCPALTEVTVAGATMPTRGAAEAIFDGMAACARLRSASFTGFRLVGEAMGGFTSGIAKCTTLRELRLGLQRFSSIGGEDFCDALAHLPHLDTLVLSSCDLERHGKALAGALEASGAQLSHLHLYACRVGDAASAAIGRALAGSASRLRYMCLDMNRVGNQGAAALGAAIAAAGPRMREVSLEENEIADKGVCDMVAAGLGRCRELRTIMLGSNQLTDASLEALVEVLSSFRGLEAVSIGGNVRMSAMGKQRFAKVLVPMLPRYGLELDEKEEPLEVSALWD
ncbi:unnamed protein product [Pedinophyceae sp. YPF-701]|nr:unnamed protein product [Pedinophyceae sp. YPF-701]